MALDILWRVNFETVNPSVCHSVSMVVIDTESMSGYSKHIFKFERTT